MTRGIRVALLLCLLVFGMTAYYHRFSYNPVLHTVPMDIYGYSNEYFATSPHYPDVKYSYRPGNYAYNQPYKYPWYKRTFQGRLMVYH